MSSKQSCWETYNKRLSEHNYGDAMWYPTPLSDSKRTRPGDVGYIRRGRFHRLFSTGCLGERKLGTDVPRTFKPLDVGPIASSQRLPGHLSSSNIREIARYPPSASTVPISEPNSSISFRLAEDQGAILMTKYPTYQEDVELMGKFEKYTKDHYDSWVAFARKTGHGDDVKPILVTGVDMTRDFAMMTCPIDSEPRIFKFTTSASGVDSVWGTWHSDVPLYKNSGPHPSPIPSPTQTMDPLSPEIPHTDATPNEYDQCVFIRYYTVRKRLGIPRIIKAGAGPHDLGPGGYDYESSLFEELSDSDSDSDTASSLFDEEECGSSATSSDSEDDTAIHNTTPDGRDDFDVIADYIFQNSDADSALIHHRDIALLREPGSSRDLDARLIEKRPRITVDEDGVGKIGDENPPANLRPHHSLDGNRRASHTGMEILKSPADQYLLLVLQQWRRLASQRPVSSNRRQIEALVNDAENQESVLGFREEGVVVVMDTLDKTLKYGQVSPVAESHVVNLRKLADTVGIPIPSLIPPPRPIKRATTPFATGGSSNTYEAFLGRSRVAVKRFRVTTTRDHQEVFRRLVRGVVLRRRVGHENILPFVGATLTSHPMAIVFGHVDSIMTNLRHGCLSLLVGAITGLEFLHRLEIVHGDLKGVNIMIDSNRCARVAEFTLAVVFQETSSNELKDTTRWTSPELLDPQKYGFIGEFHKQPPSKSTDMYAVGMTVFEVLTGCVPFHNPFHVVTMSKIMNEGRPDRPPLGLAGPLWDFPAKTRLDPYFDEPQNQPPVSALLDRLRESVDDWDKSIILLIPKQWEESDTDFEGEVDIVGSWGTVQSARSPAGPWISLYVDLSPGGGHILTGGVTVISELDGRMLRPRIEANAGQVLAPTRSSSLPLAMLFGPQNGLHQEDARRTLKRFRLVLI